MVDRNKLRENRMESIRKLFSTAAAFVVGLIGTGMLGIFLAIGLFSLPLNVIAIMRIEGWNWWAALIGAVILSIVPLVGHLAFIILAVVGGYFLIEAKFDWREAIDPTPQVLSFAQMTPEQFLPIRLLPTPTKCGVHPFPGVQPVKGRRGCPARDSEQ
jgi:hypothetical protein